MRKPSHAFASFISAALIQRLSKKYSDVELSLKKIGNSIALRLLEIDNFEYNRNTTIYLLLQGLTFEFMPLLYKYEDRIVERSSGFDDELEKDLNQNNFSVLKSEYEDCNQTKVEISESMANLNVMGDFIDIGTKKEISTSNLNCKTQENTENSKFNNIIRSKCFLIYDFGSPFSKYVSANSEFSGDSLMAGIIEGYLLGSGFTSDVSAHNFKTKSNIVKTIYVIKVRE